MILRHSALPMAWQLASIEPGHHDALHVKASSGAAEATDFTYVNYIGKPMCL